MIESVCVCVCVRERWDFQSVSTNNTAVKNKDNRLREKQEETQQI